MSKILLHRAINKGLISRFDPKTLNQLVKCYHNRAFIGSREVVGYGTNGSYSYIDRVDQPFPAIRFREDTPEIKVLKEKEKGDWKNLTIEEKKTLYRASFWRTLHEVEARNGDWKVSLGFAFLVVSVAIWVQIVFKKLIAPPLPESFSEENRRKQLRIMFDLNLHPIDGIGSKWDQEKQCWKK